MVCPYGAALRGTLQRRVALVRLHPNRCLALRVALADDGQSRRSTAAILK